MTAIYKATQFAQLAKEHGWKGSFVHDHDQDYAKVEVERKGEQIRIEWINNQLLEAPHYTLNGIKARLHCASVARRTLAGKPDMDLFLKRQRRANRAATRAGGTTAGTANNSSGDGEAVDDLTPNLPFDINSENADAEILKACRGSTLVWRNRFTGVAEMAFIPKEQNMDLKNSYYIGESSTGRPFLSFRTADGIFRAVGFDQMLQVR